MFDLGPATAQMSGLVSGVRDDQLDGVTPCSDWTVAGLLTHIHQFATVFTDNASKRPTRPAATLVADWRTAIPHQLEALARAWQQESAWLGRVSAGGIEMEAPDNALVAVEELSVHGWDLARATEQDFDVDDARLDEVDRFFDAFAEQLASGAGPFGPPVDVPDDATRLDRMIGRTGRDPGWEVVRRPAAS